MGADETVVGGTIGAGSGTGGRMYTPGAARAVGRLDGAYLGFFCAHGARVCCGATFPGGFRGAAVPQSRGGRCLAVYSMAGDVCEAALYDLQTGQLLGMQTLPDGQYEAALLPDGTAAVLDEKTGRTLHYDAGLGRCLRQEEGWGSQWLLEDTGYLWALDETGLVRRVHLCDGVRRSISSPRGRSMPWWGSVRTGS